MVCNSQTMESNQKYTSLYPCSLSLSIIGLALAEHNIS